MLAQAPALKMPVPPQDLGSQAFEALGLQGLMLRGEAELGDPFAKQLVLGLGLLFLGKQGAVEATVEVRLQSLQSSNLKNIEYERLSVAQARLAACPSRFNYQGVWISKACMRSLWRKLWKAQAGWTTRQLSRRALC